MQGTNAKSFPVTAVVLGEVPSSRGLPASAWTTSIQGQLSVHSAGCLACRNLSTASPSGAYDIANGDAEKIPPFPPQVSGSASAKTVEQLSKMKHRRYTLGFFPTSLVMVSLRKLLPQLEAM